MAGAARRIELIGCGGIGGHLAPSLCRYLHAERRAAHVVLVDGDRYEPRNAARMRFTALENKAVAMARELAAAFVQIVRRAGGRPLTNTLDRFHPEIREPADRLPTERGCGELAQTTAPQLLFTNLAVASAMLNAFYGLERGGVPYEEVYLDIVKNRVQPVTRALA
jgi:hypothetical protein